ncbi:MAG: 50S ribosomal protein L16 [Phycisphaerae bacterium]|nr:50S ribosomal protein L16 [Phycisphaerae bacterium]
MAMMPKRIKHRKQMRGKMRGNATRGNTVAFGEYGLQTTEQGWISARQIEAGRVSATHFLHREGKVYIRIFPDKPVSAKPLETRMGKGKGETAKWVAVVKPGSVLFEIGGVPETLAKDALRRVAHKMPVRCRLVHRKQTL